MADNCLGLESCWSFRPSSSPSPSSSSFPDSLWSITESFARDNDALTRALQFSLSDASSAGSPPLPAIPPRPEPASRILIPCSASGRISKRKSRASKKSPTTYITADPANFRQMVQQVTGVRFGEPGRFPVEELVRPEPQRGGMGLMAGSGFRIGRKLGLGFFFDLFTLEISEDWRWNLEIMVQLANPGKIRPRSEQPARAAAPQAVVKLEIEDPLEEEHSPLHKKPKSPAPFQYQWGLDAGMALPQSVGCSLLDEPSPLGLSLKKTPSFLDLIQMRLSQGSSATASCATSSGGFEAGKKKDLKSSAVSGTSDKLKASNFPASLLRIGSWECISRYEGDLVAKCYYAKHKLVWEVLDGGLKSKIEIQWSDITALKASCPENGPSTLDIVLARQPLFFRETNPQPRKHTLWQATSDFTNGQASIHRRHFLQCPSGLLSKHFEKLVQCDPRLNSLCQQPEITLESPYFEPRCSVFDDHNESKCHHFDDLKDGFCSTTSGFQDIVSPHTAPSTSMKNEIRVLHGRTPDNVPRETLSPSSVMDTRIIEENPTTSGTKELNGPGRWDQIKVPGLRSSMSMSDLVNHIGHCISGQTTPGNPLLPTDSSLNKSVLEELTQYLLGDSQVTSASDEQSLMSRVNSLCCLIQHKGTVTAQSLLDKNPAGGYTEEDSEDEYEQQAERKQPHHVSDGGEEPNDAAGCKPPSMSRKESYGELLMHLPRIASFPQFLFNIAGDSENQAR